ncbi:hypothetical protein [Wolbachia endosymbiont (group E) of Neria commutata]|uniref:hypothetical protein n=1 Tax=Wolbachia endosymbiont (group E) of Neria commutata TaxID=3066149 RepID=UPI00313325A1
MTNEDLRNKFYQFLIKLHDSGDLNLLSQVDSFKELISKFRNDFESLQKVIVHPLGCSAYNPKILETILNNGVDIHSNPGKLDLISGWYSWRGQFFGYNAIFRGKNVGYNIAQTLTVSIARITLQNPNLLEKQEYGRSCKENLLHSLVNTVFVYLSPDSCFSRDDADTEWESCKKHLSQLFTLMVFINPKSLEQKYSDLKRVETTPMELFSHYLLSCKRTYQYVPGIYNDLFNLEELYNNFQQVITLSKDNSNILSQKIKELINYINSIQPSSQIDSSKLNSIISEIKDQIKTQGNSPAEKCIVDVGNLLIENLPTTLLDRYISNLRSSGYQTGNVSEEMNEKLSFILDKEVFKTIDLLNKKSALNDVINHIEDPSVQRLIEKYEEDFLKFKEFKEFLADNPAPHEPISQKRLDREGRLENTRSLKDQRKVKIQENEKISEEALMDIQEKLKSEKAQEKALPCINTSLTGGKKVPLKENNQNGFKIITTLVITCGIVSASVITGIYFESFTDAIAVAAILTIAACCIGYCCNSKVDSQLISPQAKGNVSKLATQH